MRWVLRGSGIYLVCGLITLAVTTPATASLHWIIMRAELSAAAETAAVLLLAAAHWKLGRPPADDPDRSAARYAYRGGVLLVASAKVTWLALMFLAPARFTTVANSVGMVGIVIGTIGFYGYIRELCGRVPSDRMAKMAGVLQWWMSSALAFYVGLALWVQVAKISAKVLGGILYAAVGAMAVLVIGTVVSILLIVRLKERFSRAAIAPRGSNLAAI